MVLVGFTGVTREISERKIAENKLLKSEEKFRLSFMNSSDVMYIATEEEGLFVEVNDAFKDVFGYTREETIGKTSLQLNLFADPDSRKKMVAEFTRNNTLKDYEILCRRKGGEIFVISINVNKLIFENEPHTLGVIRDITSNKLAEQKLQASEQKYRELIDGMRDTAWVINLNGNLIDVNKTATEVLGYSREELISLGLFGIDSTLKKENIQALVKSMPLDKQQIFETSHKAKDGRIFPVEVSSGIIFYNGENAILSIARDITERKNAQNKILENNANLTAILETSEDLIAYRDLKNCLVAFNDSFKRVFKKISGTEAVPDLNTTLALTHKERKHWEKILGDVINGTPYRGEFKWDFGKGDIRHYDISINPIKNGEQIIGTLEINRDITDRRKSEIELTKHSNLLAKLNQYSLDLSKLEYNENMDAFICRELKNLTGAEVSTFTEFDEKSRALIVKHIELKPGLLKTANSILGDKINNIESIVDEETYKVITQELIGIRKTIHEVSFGVVPKRISSLIQSALNIDRFIGMAFIIDGNLFGTSVVGMKKDQPDPPKDILENFVFLTASALRRKKAEKKLSSFMKEYH